MQNRKCITKRFLNIVDIIVVKTAAKQVTPTKQKLFQMFTTVYTA